MNRVDVDILAMVVATMVPCWLASVGNDADALSDESYQGGFQRSQQRHPDATTCADEAMRRAGPQVSALTWLNGCVDQLRYQRTG
ncbi:MAG: hypothetical protein M3257_08675 [Actinomycetota bacterium]|nr:hypothetical protein [Actinomycetota bacterium]